MRRRTPALALCPTGCPEVLCGALLLRRGKYGPWPRSGRHPPIRFDFPTGHHPAFQVRRWLAPLRSGELPPRQPCRWEGDKAQALASPGRFADRSPPHAGKHYCTTSRSLPQARLARPCISGLPLVAGLTGYGGLISTGTDGGVNPPPGVLSGMPRGSDPRTSAGHAPR